MSRVPIRLRLTLAFAATMAVVLAGAGLLLHARLASSLDEAVNSSLETRLADVTAAARLELPELGAGADPEESFAQIVASDGAVLDATALAGSRSTLSVAEIMTLSPGAQLRLERDAAPGLEGRARLLATAVDTTQGRRAVVVGASLQDRAEALAGLRTQLLLVGPIALLLTSLLGYGLASAARRPGDALRAQAGGLAAPAPGRRLRVPTARDELARLAETLNAMLDRLETALDRERGFVADASHELRTPLAILRTELDLALRRPRTTGELEDALRSAAHETERLSQLAEDLLVLARSDQGQLPLRHDTVSVEELLDRVARRFAERAATSGRSIVVQALDGLSLTGDGPRLEQALGNLVANALEHGAGTVRMGGVARNGAVELHVVDEGPGVPAEFVPKAFDRFTRVDPARSGGGAGLGLALVDAVARSHGGLAHIGARADGGADVWIAIPAPQPPPVET